MDFNIQSARDHLKAKNFISAVAQYQNLISKSPSNHILYLELSSALMGLHKLDEALVVIRQIEPQGTHFDEEVELQKGNIYLAQGRFLESLNTLEPLLLGSCQDRVRTALSSIYIHLGLPSKAVALFDDSIFAKLSIGDIHNLAISLSAQLETTKALELLSDRIAKNNYDSSTISNLLMLSNYVQDPNKYIPIATSEITRASRSTKTTTPPRTRKNTPKIGFVSGDMNQHPVGWFSIGLLQELVKKYPIAIYYTGHKIDQLTKDIAAITLEFCFAADLTNDELIKKIQSDQVDILIDLSGHTAHSRISIFNHRIAPVQLSYLGYFSSTYMPQMDGVIFDKLHMNNVPKEFFSETVYELPCSRFCYTPPPYTPKTSSLPALANGVITFSSFSGTSKLNNECIEMWAKTLIAIPNSRIQLRWITLRDHHLRSHIRSLFLSHGVANSRVELYADCDHESLFHFYNEVDIALDTYPFSGATTSCEALWMGIPVITRAGRTPASNQAASILSEIGLDEYITSNIDEFIDSAKKLSLDTPKLSLLRSTMRERISMSSLGNPKIFASHFSKLINAIYAQ
jgi:protein O-GlcNAc transferase